MLKIAMLSTGEEVLHGDILDTNAAWLSRQFYQQGFSLTKRSTVGDEKRSLVNELVGLSLNYQVVIVNGGLGPTSDDITAEAAAEAAEQELQLSEQWVEVMQQMFSRSGRSMPASNIKQAMLPEGSVILDNPIGTACGFSMQINNAVFYFTPGVPSEFKQMVEAQILPDLNKRYPQPIRSAVSRMYTFGLTESGLSDVLDNIQLPDGFELGYRSYLPFIEVKLFGPEAESDVRLKLMQIIYSHLGDNIVGVDEELIDNLAGLLSESGNSVSVSEVATGGVLSSEFHSNEGCAASLVQGWILNNAQNIDMADQDPLAASLALAAAIREKTASRIGLSVGKLEEDRVAIALSTASGEWGQLIRLRRKYQHKDRRNLMATVALDMLRRHLENKPVFGEYSSVERIKELFVPVTLL
ncbi:CinA family nicotinamide mononucleotide deamidase-related protein [Vibrio sp. SCSIO 43137]|uniref:CinA family nicotinamide mononucleotide deamidase-related protein n=1 Tax=Vibrio sp. SCSIO 43137 TaxID=3021011 RepID=UPI002306F04B|nr:CinA family nicotinamide mononucleotide deamidase-related protein [Vibrio sp. SCSIO 43137]WCE28378.1 CinA family nicotinamide mononucleotide deamidase-related protein [Vibrio sp. SCSIO 43137]